MIDCWAGRGGAVGSFVVPEFLPVAGRPGTFTFEGVEVTFH